MHYKEFIGLRQQSSDRIMLKTVLQTKISPTVTKDTLLSRCNEKPSIPLPPSPNDQSAAMTTNTTTATITTTTLSSSSISTPFSSLNTVPQLCADSFYNGTDDDDDDDDVTSMSSAAYDDQGPAKMSIDDFIIIKVLGKGCMGKVGVNAKVCASVCS